MTSIVFSFVGNQDPVSHNTNEEGSIVTLIKHLLTENKRIKKIILLHTIETRQNAEDTREWLLEALDNSPFQFDDFSLIPVQQKLSEDPVNLSLVIEEVKQRINEIKKIQQGNDILELNSSSGTPTMKASLGILQGAGYIPKSNIWQIRNPHKILEGQVRVFQTNVDILKREFDIKVIKKQVNNYNYNGALATFKSSSISDQGVSHLLQYGAHRLAFNFRDASENIRNFRQFFGERLTKEINKLANKNQESILIELYYHILSRQKTQEYSQFLILVFGFQEFALKYLVRQYLAPDLLQKSWNLDIKNQIISICQNYQQGELQEFIQQYQLNLEYLSRPVMLRIIQYPAFSCPYESIIKPLNYLEEYCKLRNDLVHQFEGVSKLDISENELKDIVKNIQTILAELFPQSFIRENSFAVLNKKIFQLL